MPPAWQLVLEYSCLPAARPVAVPYRGPPYVQMVCKKIIVRVSGHLPCPLSIVHYLWYDVRRKGRENMLIHVTQIDEETVRNTASQALHSQCGFVPTEEPPRNPWGELEEGTVLFRFSRS